MYNFFYNLTQNFKMTFREGYAAAFVGNLWSEYPFLSVRWFGWVFGNDRGIKARWQAYMRASGVRAPSPEQKIYITQRDAARLMIAGALIIAVITISGCYELGNKITRDKMQEIVLIDELSAQRASSVPKYRGNDAHRQNGNGVVVPVKHSSPTIMDDE